MKNIVLIGMPASGKSVIGKELSKKLGFDFVDTDRYIEKKEGRKLSDIFEKGEKGFKKIEEKNILSLNIENYVISTGGSVVLSPKIMHHLKKQGFVLYLHLVYKTIKKRISNAVARAVVGSKSRTLKEIYDFRVPLYKKYADKIINLEGKSLEQATEEIENLLKR